MRFEITWQDGHKEEVEQSDCNSAEQFISCRFGSAGPRGATIVVVGAAKTEESAPKQKPVVEKQKAKVTKPASDGAVTREE